MVTMNPDHERYLQVEILEKPEWVKRNQNFFMEISIFVRFKNTLRSWQDLLIKNDKILNLLFLNFICYKN